jgi:cholesterol oxidase
MNETHFDAVVIGSGFGGSVMAYRLAKAGLRVCILERGQEYPPGAFPRSPYKMKKNFWDPSEGLYGMFNLWSFSGLGAVVSSGLGGGSLIYANVLIRKDERWFVKEDIHHGGYEYWPVTRAELEPHYDRVEEMLNAQTYPYEDETPKTIAFREAANKLKLDWFLPKLAVTFGNPGEDPLPGEPIREEYQNMFKRTRYTCRLCGECDIGCNYGSKNTLDFNYLSQAKVRYGADIRSLCEVRAFEPRKEGRGYTIYYVKHDLEREGKPINTHDPSVLPLCTVTADRLILSAGTLNTTYLLLKNRGAFPHLSKLLGTRFCGNGDLLTFAVKSSDTRDGRRVPRVIDGSRGTVITSTVRVADREDGGEGRGFYLQDAGYPEFVNWILQVFDTPGTLHSWWHDVGGRLVGRWLSEELWWRSAGRRLVDEWLSEDPETDVGAEMSRLFGECELSAGSLPLLGMGRDIPDGKMELRRGKLNVDWRIGSSNIYLNRVRRTMQSITGALGAKFVDNPSWHLSRLITVHPLGGCPMGRDEREGVVDSYGQVFRYPGLYVADGSVMPGPVGPNPSLTIAALADRFAERIIQTK